MKKKAIKSRTAKTREFADLVPLSYIRFINVPTRRTKAGVVVDLEPHVLEILAAKALVTERIPFRGQEVRFLRKALGLSLEKFARKLGLSAATVLHWEKAEDQRLSTMNEAGVRAFVAEELGLKIEGRFSTLLGTHLRELKISAHVA